MMCKIFLVALLLLMSTLRQKCTALTRCEEFTKNVPAIYTRLFPEMKDFLYSFSEYFHPGPISSMCSLDKLTDMQWMFITYSLSDHCMDEAKKAARDGDMWITIRSDRCQFMRDMQSGFFGQEDINVQMSIIKTLMGHIFQDSAAECALDDIPESSYPFAEEPNLKVYIWAAIQANFQCLHDNIPPTPAPTLSKGEKLWKILLTNLPARGN